MSSVVTRGRTVIGFSALSAAIVLPACTRRPSGVGSSRTPGRHADDGHARSRTPKQPVLGRTFHRIAPWVTVDVIRTTGQVAFQRLSLDVKIIRRIAMCSAPPTSRVPAPEGTLRSGAVHAGQQC